MFRPLSRVAHQASRASVNQFKSQRSNVIRVGQVRVPTHVALRTVRFASSKQPDDPPPPKPKIDYEKEKEIGQRKLQSDPKNVTLDSSRNKGFDFAASSGSSDPDTAKELKHDIGVVKETFDMATVPRESQVLGLLGTVPYLATSCSTLYLAWDLHKPGPTGGYMDALFISHDSAKHLLSIIEPLQLGYGAVIISFLGAIHWGLEYAEKQRSHSRTRFRYGMGLAASVVAWPTVLMPLEFALTSQFMAFIGLYFADARATRLGWAPSWYGTYRFMLTALVGAAILVSLLGRAKIRQADHLSYQAMAQNLEQKGLEDTDTDWTKLEQKEKERRRREEEKKREAAMKAEEAEKKKKKQGEGKQDGKDNGSKSTDDNAEKKNKEDGDEEKQEKGKENKKDGGDDSQQESKEEGKEGNSGSKEDGKE